MIPRSAITHWNKQVPWEDIANVEQDLIITRALTDIFSDDFLASELAFRGGTALRKRFAPGRPDGREVCRPHAVLPSNREAEKGRNKSSTTDGERLVPGYR